MKTQRIKCPECGSKNVEIGFLVKDFCNCKSCGEAGYLKDWIKMQEVKK